MQRRRLRGGLLAALFFGACAVAFAFLALPIVAIFTQVPPGRLVRLLSNPIVTDALVVSFKTTLDRAGADPRSSARPPRT